MNLVEQLEQQQRETLTERQGLERQLGAIADKSDPRRESLKQRMSELDARRLELKEQIKSENTRRNFAGIGSPLHEACVARLDAALVAELEAEAVLRQQERQRRAEERRSQKPAGPAPTPSPPSKPPVTVKPVATREPPPAATRASRPVVIEVDVRARSRPSHPEHRSPERSRA